MFDDRSERARHAVFTRRAVVLLGAQVGVAGLLGARLYELQIVDQAQYEKMAENNRIDSQSIAPARGEIFDRHGAPLAVNRPNYMLRFVRERVKDVDAAIADLQRFVTLSENDLEDLERAFKRSRKFKPVLVKEDLDWETYARLNANAPALPGAVMEVGLVRSYPEADAFAHVIGYVGAVNKDELKRDKDPILRLPGARIGKAGVERTLEQDMRGDAGLRSFEVDVRGREIQEIDRIEGTPGADVALTIDLDLQRYTMERIKNESAAVVVMDVITGDLLVLASGPAFDPNKFVFGFPAGEYADLNSDEYKPLFDKAIMGQYPPGSTFKMITAMAALESGQVSTRQSFNCTGKLFFGNRNFHCWKRRGHGRVNMKEGVKNSCDVYFYEIGKAAGINKIAEVAKKFGVGEKFELEIPGVRRGILPSREWKMAARGESWNAGETLNTSIGQGDLLMTPLQMAVMTARIANGREQVRPRLIRKMGGAEPERALFEPLGVSQEALEVVRAGMFAVSNETGGTAYRSRIEDPENLLAGKTGTAQVRKITQEERDTTGVLDNDELPWRLRDHALFVAFAPTTVPRYAISVIVEHGGSGSKAAAPVARDILMRALYGPKPPLEAYPPHMRKEIERAREAAEQARENGTDPIQSL